jgi:hypothetical protein
MNLLPQAVRRRFDKRIYIPLPDTKARQHMFKVLKNLSNLTIFILMVKTSNSCAVKRDLKDWSIIKEIALDRGEWKLAIHQLLFYCLLMLVFYLIFICPLSPFL